MAMRAAHGVQFFAELRLLLGAAWLTDPLLGQLRAAFEECEDTDENERLDQWYESVEEYMDLTFGEDDVLIARAVSRLDDPFQLTVQDDLSALFPEKWALAEEPGHAGFLRHGEIEIVQWNLCETARLLYLRMMVLLGTGFSQDPVFRQLRRLLDEDPTGRSFCENAPEWLRKWRDSFPPIEEE